MGGICEKEVFAEPVQKKATPKKRDLRKKNSLIFGIKHIHEFQKEQHDIDFLMSHNYEAARLKKVKEEAEKGGKKRADPRTAGQNRILDSVAEGSLRAVREQVIGHFATINRHFLDKWDKDTILHVICREAYLAGLEFMMDSANRSHFDSTEIEIDIENNKRRTPLHTVFTPSHLTNSAGRYGLNDDGTAKSFQPESIPQRIDWMPIGGVEERKQMVKILVEHGADVNKLDLHDYSPLHMACMWGWTDTAEILIEKGAKAEQVTITGNSALMLAVQQGNFDTAAFLLEETEMKVNARNVEGDTALFMAVEMGDDEMVELLCSYEAEVDALNYAKKTPLKLACALNNEEVIQILLDYGCGRRPSAFELITEDEVATLVQARCKKDDDEAREEAERQKLRFDKGEAGDDEEASAYGQWVPFLDKNPRNKQETVFYYNTISRVCQREKPDDYILDRSYIMKKGTFGMHFYH